MNGGQPEKERNKKLKAHLQYRFRVRCQLEKNRSQGTLRDSVTIEVGRAVLANRASRPFNRQVSQILTLA